MVKIPLTPIKVDLKVELEREGDSELFDDLNRYLSTRPRLTRFLFNPAGFTFCAGILLFLGMAMGAVGIWIVDRSAGIHIMDVVATEIYGGREVAIPKGIIQFGLPSTLVFGAVAIQDLITTSWIYPVFYFTRRNNMGRRNFVGYFFQEMAKKAEKNKKFVERYGAVGLFFFMLIPFAVNGPLIGAIIGKLAGIRTRYILPTVVLATFVATGVWVWLWRVAGDRVLAFTEHFGGKEAINLVMTGLVAIFISITLIGVLGDFRRYRRLKKRDEERARRAFVAQTLYATETEEAESANRGP